MVDRRGKAKFDKAISHASGGALGHMNDLKVEQMLKYAKFRASSMLPH